MVNAEADGSPFRHRILVWSPPAAEPVCLGMHEMVTTVAVLPNGWVATGSLLDDRILLWDPDRSGEEPAELGRHGGRVDTLAVLADGGLVSSGQDQDVVQLWDPVSGEVRARIACSVESVATVAVSEQASVIAIAHRGGDWSLWFHGMGQLSAKPDESGSVRHDRGWQF